MAIGNVALAAPSQLLPYALCKTYQRATNYQMLTSWYSDGMQQRSSLVIGPRNTWVITQRLTPTAIAALQAFFISMQGNTEPFYFYDCVETPGAYDPTTSSPVSRYTVRFNGQGFAMNCTMARSEAQLALIEVY